MNAGRKELLAGASVAKQQHRRIGGGHLFDLMDHAAERGALAHYGTGLGVYRKHVNGL
jgi:hypothetical protein